MREAPDAHRRARPTYGVHLVTCQSARRSRRRLGQLNALRAVDTGRAPWRSLESARPQPLLSLLRAIQQSPPRLLLRPPRLQRTASQIGRNRPPTNGRALRPCHAVSIVPTPYSAPLESSPAAEAISVQPLILALLDLLYPGLPGLRPHPADENSTTEPRRPTGRTRPDALGQVRCSMKAWAEGANRLVSSIVRGTSAAW